MAAEQRLKSSRWYAILILLTCVEAALPAYGAHTWYVTYVPLSYTTYVDDMPILCGTCTSSSVADATGHQLDPIYECHKPANTAAAYQNTAFGNIFYETSGSLLPGGVLLTIPHIRALKLAFDTTNYWNPHILILVGALPNHRRDQHSIFSKRKGLTSLSYFKYTVGYF